MCTCGRLFVVNICIWVAILFFSSCNSSADKLFTKLDSSDTGIDFVNTNHETELSNILTYEYFYNGGGVALGDINNDGLVDIYFTSNIFKNKLYLNQGNLRFKDITETSGTACEIGWKTGVTMADVNSDGLVDIYVCRSASPNSERRRNILLINNGDLTFTDRSKEYNLDDSSYSTQAAFFDYDNDGDLDMVLLNHSLLDISNSFNISIKNTNMRYPEVGNKLYRNDGGHFKDVSDAMGVYGSAFNYGLGISLSDINNDGWVDMYLGCDYTGRDKLLINEQGKYFRDATHDQLSHISKFTMGTDIADINQDGLMDILTLDMLPKDNYRQKQLMGVDGFDVHNTMVKNGLHAQYMRNMLHLNNGNGTFSEIGQLAGISNTDWSWGGLIQDFDNDGNQDIIISNGFKRDLTNNDFAKFQAAQEINAVKKAGKAVNMLDIVEKFEENKLPNFLFKGNGDLTFLDVTEKWGLTELQITNGIAYGDLDNDGDLEIITNNMNEEASIYRNNTNSITKNNFLSIELKAETNTNALGARATVFAGNRKFTVEQLPVRGFQSQVDPVLHVGLGTNTKVDSVIVFWPGDSQTKVMTPPINKKVIIAKNTLTNPKTISSSSLSFLALPDTLFTDIKENDFNDFNIQPLLPNMYSKQGPALAIGDINGDGLNDLYVGAPKGKVSKLMIQNGSGEYKVDDQKIFNTTLGNEEIDATFFDMDGDHDLDLYVVTGGYEFTPNDDALKDRLYENNGTGFFTNRLLPEFLQSGSCVRYGDIDNDNDLDLFIGGRISVGRYPENPISYILLNDGKGNFTIDKEWKGLKSLGMVTDAEWLDLNGDTRLDLIVVGEWMSVKAFINDQSGFSDRSAEYFKQPTEGLWNNLLVDDFDKDGDKDLVIGNYGINNQFHVANDRPMTLLYADFDKNGSVDPIINYFIQNKSYPYPTRDELVQQLPSFKKRFTNYHSYSIATISAVLNSEEFNAAQQLSVSDLRSSYFENKGTHFIKHALPIPFQFSPIFSSVTVDFNNDGMLDIISAGNLSATRARTGRLTGNYGLVALGDGQGNFQPQPAYKSGLHIKGDVRHMIADGKNLIVAINDRYILLYKLKLIR